LERCNTRWTNGTLCYVGPALRVIRAVAFVLSAMAMILSVRWIVMTAGLRRKQALWFVGSGLVSMVGNMILLQWFYIYCRGYDIIETM